MAPALNAVGVLPLLECCAAMFYSVERYYDDRRLGLLFEEAFRHPLRWVIWSTAERSRVVTMSQQAGKQEVWITLAATASTRKQHH